MRLSTSFLPRYGEHRHFQKSVGQLPSYQYFESCIKKKKITNTDINSPWENDPSIKSKNGDKILGSFMVCQNIYSDDHYISAKNRKNGVGTTKLPLPLKPKSIYRIPS